MAHNIRCYRCGESLATLSLPFSRQDECPGCGHHLHVCRMCIYFDPRIARQCAEDGAEEVGDKEKPNFCDWFKPSETAFDADRKNAEDAARAAAEALFGD